MDSIVSAALEEICSQGAKGLALTTLWIKLQSPLSSQGLNLCDDVKRAIWSNLLSVPGLSFEARGASYDSADHLIQSFEASEKLNLNLVAADHLRNSFVGIYDIAASNSGITEPQRRVLERLAIASTNGITQSELAKELGIKGNNIFYILKNLECRGLIVRQSTILRTKESLTEGGYTHGSVVTTNMLHLYRYGKHLGCQQRLEIVRDDINLADIEHAEGPAEDCVSMTEGCTEDVRVKDFLPALKAICDKLEQADGKVLVVSDIKRDLGYRRTSGHRAWRNICNRLKDARVVEEFCAKVNEKEVSCLRLLKKFAPKNFQPKTVGNRFDDLETEQLVKLGKRGQVTEQLVELPIEHQIFDMIDAAGTKGLTISEVCRRLGINNKQYYSRLHHMIGRFGMHMQAENHNRGVAYRIWTSKNYNPEASKNGFSKSETFTDGAGISSVDDQAFNENSAQTIMESSLSTCKNVVKDVETENRAIEPVVSQVPPTVETPVASGSDEAIDSELSHRPPADELPIVSVSTSSASAELETSATALSVTQRSQSYPRYPCLTLTAASALREQRILHILQEEKFLIRAELRRQLESLEKDKHTLMDRRTLDRSLNKLQQEGLCRCIRISVPVITNCGRSRITDVVLHPSVLNVTPDLLGEIHDKMRSFDMKVRGQGSSRLKKGESVPVLNNIPRTTGSTKSDVQAERSEAMRSNGFVLAKMVRTKLLHIFFWGYLSSTPGWDDAFSFGENLSDLKNPHSTCKLFALDAAIKAMPLELFLQVVGSTQKFEDMIKNCRAGLRLSDLPKEEYSRLMDTQATGRLSWIIDILRRLKLIRLVSGGQSEDVTEVQHAILTHALELKPYIEEPVLLLVPSSALSSVDLRPQIRHDFILSSSEAVDLYWNTLEYCYSAADSKAALHAFPGSSVHEVFVSRSWASVRVMTAEQRAQLLKRVMNDNPSIRLSFKECENIAKDLNLTLQQVLRIYYDKRQQRLTNFQGVLNAQGEEFQPPKTRHSSRKRKRSLKGRSSKLLKTDSGNEHSGSQRVANSSHNDEQFTEKKNSLTSSENYGSHLHTNLVSVHADAMKETELNKEAEEHHSFIHKCALSKLRSTREKKFLWTEKTERQLVIEYVRHRVALGAKFHRIDWSSLRDLPAPPNACKRRMALLNSNMKFRKAVLRLCNRLSKRYMEHLKKSQGKLLDQNQCELVVQDSLSGEDCNRTILTSAEDTEELGSEEQWDDFENHNIKIALDEILRFNRMAKLEASKRNRSVSEEWSGLNMEAEGHDPQETALFSTATPNKGILDHGEKRKVSGRRLGYNRLPQRYVKLLNEGIGVSRRVYKSLAVSSASELFKLVFLSTSNAPEVPNVLAETLRRYSEHDLFAAFNYLREKRVMVGGKGFNPFVLSQQYLQSISSSPFPANTGKRAARFASWLHDREKDLLHEAVDLTADLHCGDIFHLFALVSSGELLISPCLPDEGVGESDDLRMSKRKLDGDYSEPKKLKSSLIGEGEIISRRGKGFPGIRLSISQVTISGVDALEFFKNGDSHAAQRLFGEHQTVVSEGKIFGNISFHSDHGKEMNNPWSTVSSSTTAFDSPWESMKSFAEHLMYSPSNQEWVTSLHPELFRTVYLAIQKAGDQGLSMIEVSQVMNMQGEIMAELVVEVLEAFGRVLKVNAYDSIQVVDSLYRSKYFLTPVAGSHQDIELASPTNSKGTLDGGHDSIQPDYTNVTSHKGIKMTGNEVHKVTILNLPDEGCQASNEIRSGNELEGCMQAKNASTLGDHEDEIFEIHSADSHFCRPILPWINGDGTINKIVYRGLVRRVFGILMQNPGIVEDDIIKRMDVLNPQSCRTLLELMILDNHIIVRKMNQTTSAEPPAILASLIGSCLRKSKMICREHFFANPMSTSLL